MEDTDPSILYQPAASWHSNLEACSTCLKLGTPPDLSYHECMYPLPPEESSRRPSTPKPLATTPASIPQDTLNQFPDPPAQISPLKVVPARVPAAPSSMDDRNGNSTRGRSDGGKPAKRRELTPRPGVITSKLGLNDPNQVDPDISVSFNFTGSALYVFGIQPLGVANSGAPTNMNLSFTLDNQPSGDFHSSGTPGATGFNLKVPVFIKRDLEESRHHFIAHVGRNSTFLLDYIIYTSVARANGTPMSLVSPTALPQNSPSSIIDPKTKKHNIATFAAAVGGSVGVLGVFSLGLAISIIGRRRQAARRDRLESQSESLQANGRSSNDSPGMFGPAPFIPRYFPDTIIPTDPPTYTVALATGTDNSTLLPSMGSRSGQTSAHPSYADMPPASPPPPLDDAMVPPPPPFPVAVSIPFLRQPPPLQLRHEGAATPLRRPDAAMHLQNGNSAISGLASNANPAAPERASLQQEMDSASRHNRGYPGAL